MAGTRPPDDHVGRLRRLDVCAVSDAMDALAVEGGGEVPGVVALWEGAKLVGRAVTMRLAEGEAPPTAAKVHLGARAIEAAGPGDVIVVDNAGRLGMGSWGGLLSLAASVRGIAGVVIDGACRDVDEAREMRFAAFGRAGVARTARGRVHEVSVGEPVRLAGVAVRVDDVVTADASGVVVVPADRLADVVARAEEIGAREDRMRTRLLAGDAVSDVLGAAYEGMLRPR